MPEYIFGDLLKTLRKAKRLSQQALADKLGVHRNTIWGWEQGVYLPDSRGMVLELARQLGLDEQETRQLLEASLTTVSAYWNVPFARNSFFTGREEILEALHAQLGANQAATLTQSYALHGLGGIGKTQVAVEYAYRHRFAYDAVLWVEAETQTTLVSSFVALAELLALPERTEEDQRKIVASVLRWLNQHQNWLLLFDNVEDLALLKSFLPASGQGVLLLTTRLHTLGTVAQPIELPPMTREEGLAFLLARSTRYPGDKSSPVYDSHERAAAQEIVAAMGGLPLALDQAGAYIDATQCSLSDYLRLLQSSQYRLLDEQDLASDHPLSVSRTFALAFERIEQQNPAAAEILTVCAFLAPDAIPESFFLEGATQLGPTFEALAADPLAFQDALKTLLTYSLLQRGPATHTLTIHRLVQVVHKERLAKEIQRSWARRIVEALSQLFPIDEGIQEDYWQAGKRLLSHALMALEFSQRWEEDEVHSLALRCLVAAYLCNCAQYAEAEVHFERCLRVGEALLGSEHPLVAEALYGRAKLYFEQSKYAEAEPLYQRALSIREQQLGPAHPLVAHSLNGLAHLYREQSKYAEAEPLYQRALSIQEQQLGPAHPQITQTLTGLAHLYRDQGKYTEAEPLYQRALHIWEQQLGPAHPQVAHSLNGLANLYSDQGKCAEAEPLYQRALYIWEQQVGSEHPLVAAPLNNLASLYHDQGKYKEAELLYQRALHIWEQQLGPAHPRVAYALTNLANLYCNQGRYVEAEPFYQRALHIFEQQVGPEYIYVAYPLQGLANVYREQGKYEQAAPLYQRASAIYQRHVVSNHPDFAEHLHDFAHFQQMQQHNEESLSLYQQALAIREQVLGPHHPKTEATRAAYAQLLQEMGRIEEAARVLSAQVRQEQES